MKSKWKECNKYHHNSIQYYFHDSYQYESAAYRDNIFLSRYSIGNSHTEIINSVQYNRDWNNILIELSYIMHKIIKTPCHRYDMKNIKCYTSTVYSRLLVVIVILIRNLEERDGDEL